MAIYLGLGSNLGNRRANIALALSMLPPLVSVEAVSPLYESPPQAPAPPPAYFNAVCRVVTGLQPLPLLRHLKRIEQLIGRRPAERWAPRPIDLDILLYYDLVLDESALSLPHPRLTERAFVLFPLLDLDPDLGHPASKERLADLPPPVGIADLKQVAPAGWHQADTPISTN